MSFWKEDLFQVASIAFWHGWERIGKPNPLSFKNLAYLKTAIYYALHDAACKINGTGMTHMTMRQIKLAKQSPINIVPVGLIRQDERITSYAEKQLNGTTSDNSDPYYMAAFTDWIENGMDDTSRKIVTGILANSGIGEISKAAGINPSTVWRRRRALRKSFSDYVDFPVVEVSA